MNSLSMKKGKIKMEDITMKLIAAGILFLLTLISGVILSNSVRPLGVGLTTIHKLIAVGTVILIGLAANQLYRTAEGKMIIEVSLAVVSGILFLALIATGALLTREGMALPAVVLKVHQVAPVLALVSSSVLLYLMIAKRA